MRTYSAGCITLLLLYTASKHQIFTVVAAEKEIEEKDTFFSNLLDLLFPSTPGISVYSSRDAETLRALLRNNDIVSLGLISWADANRPDPCGYSNCCDPVWLLKGISKTSDRPCAWQGVCCEEWRVVAVDLSCEQSRCLAPLTEIPWSSLAKLPELKAVSVSGNNVRDRLPNLGTPIASVFPAKLEYLDASHNLYNGVLPSSWYRLLDLKFINLGFNELTGGLPSAWAMMSDLETLNLEENSLQGNIPVSWLALGPKYGGSLGQLNLRKNCGLCGENVPAPPGTVVETSGTSLGSGCSVFNCSSNMLPYIMIGIGVGCLVLALCIIGRVMLRRCGPQGFLFVGGPTTRIHVDPQWASVFGGDPRGPQRPAWLPPPLLIAIVDGQKGGPLVSESPVWQVATEGQLQAIKENGGLAGSSQGGGEGGPVSPAPTSSGGGGPPPLVSAVRHGLMRTASSPAGQAEVEMGESSSTAAAGSTSGAGPSGSAPPGWQYDPEGGMEQFAHLFSKIVEVPFDALVLTPDLEEVMLGMKAERLHPQPEDRPSNAEARNVGGRIRSIIGMGRRDQAAIATEPIGRENGGWEEPGQGSGLQAVGIQDGGLSGLAVPSPGPAVLSDGGGGGRRGRGRGRGHRSGESGRGSVAMSEHGRPGTLSGVPAPLASMPSAPDDPDHAPSAPPLPGSVSLRHLADAALGDDGRGGGGLADRRSPEALQRQQSRRSVPTVGDFA